MSYRIEWSVTLPLLLHHPIVHTGVSTPHYNLDKLQKLVGLVLLCAFWDGGKI